MAHGKGKPFTYKNPLISLTYLIAVTNNNETQYLILLLHELVFRQRTSHISWLETAWLQDIECKPMQNGKAQKHCLKVKWRLIELQPFSSTQTCHNSEGLLYKVFELRAKPQTFNAIIDWELKLAGECYTRLGSNVCSFTCKEVRSYALRMAVCVMCLKSDLVYGNG